MGSDFHAGSKPRIHFMSDSTSAIAHTDLLGEAHLLHIDVVESPGEVIVEMDIPGVTRADLNIAIDGTWFVVEGMKKENDEPREKVTYLCVERGFGPIRRTIRNIGSHTTS